MARRGKHDMQVAESLLDLVGNTPLVRLGRVGADLARATSLAKVELFNPGGSVKDRPAVAMIDAAERDGLLQPGGVIVEPTSGNTGVGLAIVAAQRGYRCIFVMSDKMSNEKVALLRGVRRRGGRVPHRGAARAPRLLLLGRRPPHAGDARRVPPRPVLQPGQPGRARALDRARDLASRPTGASRTSSPASAPAAPSPASPRYLKAQNPDVQIVGADPEGSVYSGGTGRPYLVEGVGEDFWPTTYDPSLVDRTVMVSDAESFASARRVTREEGLLIGGSCGTAVHAALVVGAELGPDDVVVVLLPDSGRNYLSKIFDDDWMIGLRVPPRSDGHHRRRRARGEGRLHPRPRRDHRRRRPRATRSSRMRELGVSQLVVAVTDEPPLAAKEISGMVSELPLMDKAFRDPGRARPPGRRGDGARAADGRASARRCPTSSTASTAAPRCSCSTAATRSACSPAPTC